MESKIVELRDRGRRARRTAVIVGGAGAALAVAAVGAFVVYRLTRPPTRRERLRRLAPGLPRRLRGRVPSMRLYVGDRQVGEERQEARWERLAVRLAQAAGTAAASALASRALAAVGEAARSRMQQPPEKG